MVLETEAIQSLKRQASVRLSNYVEVSKLQSLSMNLIDSSQLPIHIFCAIFLQKGTNCANVYISVSAERED